jgi:hypothetical protein
MTGDLRTDIIILLDGLRALEEQYESESRYTDRNAEPGSYVRAKAKAEAYGLVRGRLQQALDASGTDKLIEECRKTEKALREKIDGLNKQMRDSC